MAIKDLREWLEEVEKIKELKKISGADLNLEIGALTEIACKELDNRPVLLFDDIKDYQPGKRLVSGMLNTMKRLALTLNMPTGITEQEFAVLWRKTFQEKKLIPPVYVSDGPVRENVYEGRDINLWSLPAPLWHQEDGGRYLGTGCVVITKDPESEWINLGTYRIMVHDEQTLGFYISPGKHGRIHRDKYFQAGKPCPVVISFGQDPLIFLVSALSLPPNLNEFEFAGGIKGEPIEIIKGKFTGLPIPARSEIVIEGECLPGEVKEEGPFGEWTGYYGSDIREEPVIRVKTILHRNNPIITGCPPLRPPSDSSFALDRINSSIIQEEMELAGVPDVRGVFCHEFGGGRLFTAVAIKQRYPGHARQAGLIASQCHAGAYLGRFVVVVDEDINPYDRDEVLWAMVTRCDPESMIQILSRCWSGPLDPAIHPLKKGFNSRAIIDACKPWEWLEQFPHTVKCSEELLAQVREKFGRMLS